MDIDFLCSDYYNLFDSLEDWNQLENRGKKCSSGLIKFGEILYNQDSTSFVYICELCNKSFLNIETFSEHIQSIHDFHTKSGENDVSPVRCNTEGETEKLLQDSNNLKKLTSTQSLNDDANYFVIPVLDMNAAPENLPSTQPLNVDANYVVIPVSDMNAESETIEQKVEGNLNKKLNFVRARSPSIMRKINKDSRPIDFISNPWHCECGRIVPITHKYQHMKSHNDVRLFECQINGCFEIFFRQTELDEHYDLIHNSGDPKKPFSCQFCQRHFSNKKNYSSHVKKIHLNDPRNHTCPYCNYYFYSKSYLQQHIYKKHNDIVSQNNNEANNHETGAEYFEQENNFPSEEFYSDIEETDCKNDFLCKFCNTSMISNKELLAHMEKLHNIKEISLCRVCGCDIVSQLHKVNCLGSIKSYEILNEKNFEEKNSLIEFNSNIIDENNEGENIMDDDMDFLKFLNVDFER